MNPADAPSVSFADMRHQGVKLRLFCQFVKTLCELVVIPAGLFNSELFNAIRCDVQQDMFSLLSQPILGILGSMALLRLFPNFLNGLMADAALFAVDERGTDSHGFSVAPDTVANQVAKYFAFVTVVSGFNLRLDPTCLLDRDGYALFNHSHDVFSKG